MSVFDINHTITLLFSCNMSVLTPQQLHHKPLLSHVSSVVHISKYYQCAFLLFFFLHIYSVYVIFTPYHVGMASSGTPADIITHLSPAITK